MPDDRSAADGELAALRAANARLREANARLRAVAEAKDTEIAALRAALEAGQARQAEVIRRLELRVAGLERRAGMDSGNSSAPPSKESLAAKARRKAAQRASQRERSKQRRRGGQPGHPGLGLEPERDPDRAGQADPPAECRSCGAALAGAEPARRGWGQVWDIPPVRLEKVHWLLPKLRCAACGKVTCADPPDGQAGTVVYGPNVSAAAVLLGSEGNVPAERTAMVMAALLGTPVSAGFVARARERLAQRLERAGFDAAMKAALRAEPVVCADESPVSVIRNAGEDGAALAGSPHVVTVRTGPPAESQIRPGLAVHPQLRRPLDQQRLRAGDQRAETTSGGFRVLAFPGHTHPLLPSAPTWSAAATTGCGPSTPSTSPWPGTPGCPHQSAPDVTPQLGHALAVSE